MANERYQQNSHKWQTWPPLTVRFTVTSERYWANFQVTRLFHSATIFFCCHISICCLKLHRADYKIEKVFFNLDLVGALSSNVFTICAIYWSLGRRGYFGVSNIALVLCMAEHHCCCDVLNFVVIMGHPTAFEGGNHLHLCGVRGTRLQCIYFLVTYWWVNAKKT